MFRYAINHLPKINKHHTTIKCINKNNKIIIINPTTTFNKSSPSSLFNNISRFYSTNNNNNNNNNSNNNNNNNNNGSSNNNNNKQNYNNSSSNNEFKFNKSESIEYLNRNKKRILYSIGIIGLGFYSFGGNSNDNNKNDKNEELKQKYYEFFGFKVRERDLVIGSIIAANTIIFALLKNRMFFDRFAPHFFCSPQSLQQYPASIILSTFTHTEILHFAFNMYALYNFGGTCYDHMGFRDFMLLYLFGGLVGSMTSVTSKLLTGGYQIPSIGASGSILSIVGASVFFERESRLSIMFLPFSFESISFIHAILVFDLLGVLVRPLGRLTGWDHACHFGSTLFGYGCGQLYQYKTRFQNFNGSGKSINDNFIYNGTIKNGDYSGFGELKDQRFLRRGVFQDGHFIAGEITYLPTGQKRIYQRQQQQSS